MVSLKLQDPEFVGDYLNQIIRKFVEENEYDEEEECMLQTFISPIKRGMEHILFENRELRNTIEELKCKLEI